jgi:hypothetical protein
MNGMAKHGIAAMRIGIGAALLLFAVVSGGSASSSHAAFAAVVGADVASVAARQSAPDASAMRPSQAAPVRPSAERSAADPNVPVRYMVVSGPGLAGAALPAAAEALPVPGRAASGRWTVAQSILRRLSTPYRQQAPPS